LFELYPPKRNEVLDLYLKKVNIQGFKSFAEKTEVEFNSKVTAIVGPNGSGKSNIADAIRWVLGEQSVKSLRGIKMEDVIFSGTEKRRALGFSEVTITFDNSSGKIPVEYGEVAVTRRMFRSGESEYYINKNACRLKDVRELFMDTGVGKEGYSIIGQGKIDEILSNKPEDRRNIFEEAAGIIKFKTRKQEALRKLEKTEVNLTRIGDLLHEIKNQKEQLKEEAEKASEFQRLFSQLRDLDVAMTSREIKRIRSSFEKLDIKESELIEEKNLLENEIESIAASFGNIKENLDNAEKAIEDRRALKLESFQRNESIKNNIKLLQEKETYLQKEIDRYNREIYDLETSFLDGGSYLETSRIELLNLQKQMNQLKDAWNESESKKSELTKEIERLDSVSFALRNEIMDHQSRIFSLKSESGTTISFTENIKRRMTQLQEEIGIIQSDINDKVESKIRLGRELEGSRQKLRYGLDLLAREEKELTAQSKSASVLEENILDKDKTLNNLTATLKLYEAMEKDFEGYYGSVKAIAIKANEDKEFANGYLGLVADLFNVEERYLKAIEIALGSNLQNIVVSNEDTAKRFISYLKNSNKGRATFMPVSSIKGSRLVVDNNILSSNGYIGVASSLIDCDSQLNEIFIQLLGRTLIFDCIDSAIEYSKRFSYKNKIVTLDGDVINPGGSLTGGSTNSRATSILSRKQAIEAIKIETANLILELSSLRKTLESENRGIKHLNNKINEIQEKNKNQYSEILDCERRFNLTELDIERLNAELNKKSTEFKELEDELSHLKDSSNRLNKELSETSLSLENKINISKANEENLIELRSDLEKLNNEITDMRLNINILGNKSSTLDLQISQFDINEKDTRISLESKKNELRAIENQIIENRNEIENLRLIISNSQEEEIKEAGELKQLLQSKDKLMDSFYELQERNRILAQRLAKVDREIDKLDMDRSRFDVQIESMTERMQTDYDLDIDAVLAFNISVENVREEQNSIKDLRSRIKELGNVNIGAIEDYRNSVERFQFLTTQLDDLNSAREDIQLVIRDMEKKMRLQFKKSFDEINEKFQQTFSILFNGGKARLELEEGEDILTSGIEIMAQPPGKKLQSLMLLSGGEKSLTAVALLFAILKTKPSPFCILDEIDAALDEANISRYTNYLKTFDDDTQFVLITHRKTTMEIADILYGVTMEEEGVSRLISLRLKDYSEAG